MYVKLEYIFFYVFQIKVVCATIPPLYIVPVTVKLFSITFLSFLQV